MEFEQLFLNTKTAKVLGIATALAAFGAATSQTKLHLLHVGRAGSVLLLIYGLATAFGAITLFLAMCLYWAKCDRSKRWYRSFWFAVLLLGLLSGVPQVLSFLVVYLPDVRKHLQRPQADATAV
jgi:uncharacterized BrkB/YihY/UPF0761 family membrane protein